MHDYITNSKNRKLKTKILLFLSRINIGAGKLPISGRLILLMDAILFCTLFSPWISITYLEGNIRSYSAFSQYSLYIGYVILIAVVITPFFLLSHSRKEYFRSLLPFRLSDSQAVVYIMTIVLTMLVNLILVNHILYVTQVGTESILSGGFKGAFSSIICMFGAVYVYSRTNKKENTDMYYLDHHTEDDLGEYRGILD
jgi:hypothetical protein